MRISGIIAAIIMRNCCWHNKANHFTGKHQPVNLKKPGAKHPFGRITPGFCIVYSANCIINHFPAKNDFPDGQIGL